MAGVKLPNIEQAVGSSAYLPTGSVLVTNADTGAVVSIYNDRGLTSLKSASGLTTVSRGVTSGFAAGGVTFAIYVTPDGPGQAQQGPFYFEGNLGPATSGDFSAITTRVTAVETGTVRNATAADPVNTTQILQSFGGATAGGAGIPDIPGPLDVGISTNAIYSADGSGAVFQMSSYVKSTGSQAVVGVLGYGRGKHAFGGNFVGYTEGADHTAIGVEIDFGNLSVTPGGQAYGLLIRSLGGNAGGQGGVNYLQMHAAASSAADNGILFHVSSGAQPVKSTGSLILTDNTVIADRGINFAGAQFSTTGLWVPLNSGSTTASFGLILSAEGGFANGGEFIDIRSASAGSSALHGILFRLSGGNQPVTGSLIRALTSSTIGLDFAGATFSGAAVSLPSGTAIQMADGANMALGSTTGTKIGTSTASKLGFWNAVPIAKPAAITGSRSANAALADLLTKLASMGLITDSSTA